MDRFFCSKCDTWHSRFNDDGSDRLETWLGSLPDIIFLTGPHHKSPIIIVCREELNNLTEKEVITI